MIKYLFTAINDGWYLKTDYDVIGHFVVSNEIRLIGQQHLSVILSAELIKYLQRINQISTVFRAINYGWYLKNDHGVIGHFVISNEIRLIG